MSFCKRLLWLVLLGAIPSVNVFAAPATTSKTKIAKSTSPTPKPPKKFSLNFTTVSLSYLSWIERHQLSNGAQTAPTDCSMLGNALSLEWEHYYEPRYGFTMKGDLLYGVADVGGPQTTLTYHLVNQSWWGLGAETHFVYRFSRWAIATMGPVAIYRSLSLPQDPSGTAADSGSSFNYGLTAALKLRLSDQLEIREEIGAFIARASTIWSVGLGYKF